MEESETDIRNFSEEVLYDDDELDDMSDTGICIICGDFGRKIEAWFRCTGCGKWAHKECSGVTRPENYTCDFCLY